MQGIKLSFEIKSFRADSAIFDIPPWFSVPFSKDCDKFAVTVRLAYFSSWNTI